MGEAMPATVAIQYANGHVEQRTLVDGAHVVGRSSGSIVLGDADVSASHARLDVQGDAVFVTDLGSTNGTIGSDNQRVKPGQPLYAGDSLRMGRSSITLVTGAQAGGTRALAQFPDMTALAPRPPTAPSKPAPAPQLVSVAPSGPLKARGRSLRLHTGQAQKVRLSAYSATHVSGGGSTTSVGAGGYVSTVNHGVTSTVTHHTLQELWLRTPQGRDLCFKLRDANVDVLEGHSVSMLVRDSDGDVVRLLNHTTGYYYRIQVWKVGAGRRIWDCLWPFMISGFMAMPCLNLLFLIGASIEAFGGRKGWAASSLLLKLVVLGTLLAMYLTYHGGFDAMQRAERVGSHQPTDFILASPDVIAGATLMYFSIAAYYVVRAWNIQRMALALDKLAGKLL